MRDFLPADVRKRDYVIAIIKQVYESYGFEPLETPAVENIDTLMGKYGDEGNQLIFKILKRGEKLDEAIAERGTRNSELSDLALRYDLTVPLARVVANNRNELPKFFKRYQIQPVWRADRPARGRFREFYQCDVDAIGSESMVVEAEIISAGCQVFLKLGFNDFSVRINNRNLLDYLLEVSGVAQERRGIALTVIDKLDKIGINGVFEELKGHKFPPDVAEMITYHISRREGSESKFDWAFHNAAAIGQAKLESSKILANEQLQAIVSLIPETYRSVVIKDPSLARGLSYYTGTIMEINVPDLAGSLGGGGRYDALIGMFGKEQIPACGFSLGLERILVVMDERGMFPPKIADSAPADVLVTIWSDETTAESLKLAQELRASGLRVTLYPEPDKLGKQIKYADSIKVPFVAVLGESEIADGTVTVKNMKTGDQQTVARSDAASLIA
jgi:histidyl-tRNA synthetase